MCCLTVAAGGALPAHALAFPAESILVPRKAAGQLSERSTQRLLHHGVHLFLNVVMNVNTFESLSNAVILKSNS